ncbi:MAG TPA: hypothetical protein VFS77_24280 [Pyrinomonadaceae bacterium]|nr:hypothetical protein [Pyrinomonadaceae bacterium]
MYCHACGIVLTQPTKYCNRCGVQLAPTDVARKEKSGIEKRLDDYLDGLFWISVFGMAFILGGAVLLRKVQFSDLVILVYAVLSSTVFLINFGLNLWGALGLMRSAKEAKRIKQQANVETAELNPARPEMFLTPASVTENTTRSFDQVRPNINRSGSE